MKNIIKLSIIIPVYNAEKYIANCINSIEKITIKKYEIILIDDGSIDNSPSICDSFAAINNKIKVIHKKNEGVSSARNRGLDIANGEYILFVDADDWIETNRLESLLMNFYSYDIIWTPVIYDSYHKKIIQKLEYMNQGLSKNFLLKFAIDEKLTQKGYCHSKIYKKSIIGSIRFDDRIGYGEDFKFNFDVISQGVSAYISSVPFYHYVQHIDSTTRGGFSIKNFDLLDVNDFIRKNSPQEMLDIAEHNYSRILISSFFYLLRTKESEDSKKSFAKLQKLLIKNFLTSLIYARPIDKIALFVYLLPYYFCKKITQILYNIRSNYIR